MRLPATQIQLQPKQCVVIVPQHMLRIPEIKEFGNVNKTSSVDYYALLLNLSLCHPMNVQFNSHAE